MKTPKITTNSTVDVFTSPPSGNTVKERFELKIDDFDIEKKAGKKNKNKKDPDEDFQHQFLIIGFDTEYKTPDFLVSKTDIKEGM